MIQEVLITTQMNINMSKISQLAKFSNSSVDYQNQQLNFGYGDENEHVLLTSFPCTSLPLIEVCVIVVLNFDDN